MRRPYYARPLALGVFAPRGELSFDSSLFANDSSVPYGSYENVDVGSQWFVDVGSLLVHAGGSRVVCKFCC